MKYFGIAIISTLMANVQGINLNVFNKVHDGEIKLAPPTAFDLEFLKLQNQMRTDPKSFIEELTAYNASFTGHQVKVNVDGSIETMQTAEGNKPVTELIDFLKVQKPLKELKMEDALRNASCIHVKEQSSGETGHKSSNGSSFAERAIQEGINKTGYFLGENMAYGSEDAKMALYTLAIDDGVPNRGHRKNIFHENFSSVGICMGNHEKFKKVAGIIYRGKYSDTGLDTKSRSGRTQVKMVEKKEEADQDKNDELTKDAVVESTHIEKVSKHEGGALGKLEELEDETNRVKEMTKPLLDERKKTESTIGKDKESLYHPKTPEDLKKEKDDAEKSRLEEKAKKDKADGKIVDKSETEKLKISEEKTEKDTNEKDTKEKDSDKFEKSEVVDRLSHLDKELEDQKEGKPKEETAEDKLRSIKLDKNGNPIKVEEEPEMIKIQKEEDKVKADSENKKKEEETKKVMDKVKNEEESKDVAEKAPEVAKESEDNNKKEAERAKENKKVEEKEKAAEEEKKSEKSNESEIVKHQNEKEKKVAEKEKKEADEKDKETSKKAIEEKIEENKKEVVKEKEENLKKEEETKKEDDEKVKEHEDKKSPDEKKKSSDAAAKELKEAQKSGKEVKQSSPVETMKKEQQAKEDLKEDQAMQKGIEKEKKDVADKAMEKKEKPKEEKKEKPKEEKKEDKKDGKKDEKKEAPKAEPAFAQAKSQQKYEGKTYVVDNKVRDFDFRPKQLRDRLNEAPQTQTEKTKASGEEWDKKSERWTANLPAKYLSPEEEEEQNDAAFNIESITMFKD